MVCHPVRPPSLISAMIGSLGQLNQRLLNCSSDGERIDILRGWPSVTQYLQGHPWILEFLSKQAVDSRLVIYQLLAIDQGPHLLRPLVDQLDSEAALKRLVNRLIPVNHFYQSLGGLVGYHLTVCQLMRGDDLGPYADAPNLRYSVPKSIDLRTESESIRYAILEGLRRLPETAQFFAVGGAGDRLNLFDSESGVALPAACLQFGGAGCLLDLLIRDIQALEFLYFKLFDRQVLTPIAMMTSEEKNNHAQIVSLCEQRNWYGRAQESFSLFMQPLVPVVTETGLWANDGPFSPIFKPGGHGVIWKLAQDHGVFDWLKALERRKALVRQINNPVASIDNGLLAFLGLGWTHDKAFGFASCDRRLDAPEGMNVLVETESQGVYSYRLTNVEYTDFEKHGLIDQPMAPNSPYSGFPCNTNILFLDLEAVNAAIDQTSFPGMLVNRKSRFPVSDAQGGLSEVSGGRLEGTMQNIADFIVDTRTTPWDAVDPLAFSTYITYNERHKTLSVVKNGADGQVFKQDTPESCFYGMLTNGYELLTQYCEVLVPSMPSPEKFVSDGPSFIFQYHPGLGPLYKVIAQKIRRGQLAHGSHLVLEIAELELVDLRLDGSLQVRCDNPLGHRDPAGRQVYSDQNGKCTLRNVTVCNRGIDRDRTCNYWGPDVVLQESVEINIQGHGEFYAENVIFNDPLFVEVGPEERVIASNDSEGNVVLVREQLSRPSWRWQYAVDGADCSIRLNIDPIRN